MESNIEIVDPKPEDASEINELMYLSSIDSYKGQGASDTDIEMIYGMRQTEPALEHTRKMIRELSGNEKYIVAKANGAIVGICYGEKDHDQNTLHAIYVLPSFQGKGVAKILWSSVKEWLGDKDIYLKVFDGNVRAIKFYESVGLEKTGKIVNNISFGSNSLNSEIEMVLKKL